MASKILDALIASALTGGGGGGGDNAIREVVTGATPTISPVANHIYLCETTLTSLTIVNPPATGYWDVVFESGATATTVTIPATVLFNTSDGKMDSIEKNRVYEINVMDNRAIACDWPTA
jgi:uncharacterized membrane protein